MGGGARFFVLATLVAREGCRPEAAPGAHHGLELGLHPSPTHNLSYKDRTMTRRTRYSGADVSQHIYDRGNNRQRIFIDEQDYAHFAAAMFRFAKKFDIAIHAWALMPNHFHILLTPSKPDTLPSFMQFLKSTYTTYFNMKNKRTGTIWEQRYKQLLADNQEYILELYRYIELNPVRAHLTKGPRGFHWTSYHTNAMGVPSGGLTPHPYYLLLGTDEHERQKNYREFVRAAFGKERSFYEAQVAILKTAAASIAVYGPEEFHKKISERVTFALPHYQRLMIMTEQAGG